MNNLPRADPEQLLDLARAGSASALGQLLELHHSSLELLARLRHLAGDAP